LSHSVVPIGSPRMTFAAIVLSTPTRLDVGQAALGRQIPFKRLDALAQRRYFLAPKLRDQPGEKFLKLARVHGFSSGWNRRR
jgi:hypothetical protein